MKKGNPRQASKKAKAAVKEHKPLFVRKILVEDLRVGDSIARTLQEHPTYGKVAVHGHLTKVEEKVECPSAWRSHIHVNGRDCYDTRSTVHILA